MSERADGHHNDDYKPCRLLVVLVLQQHQDARCNAAEGSTCCSAERVDVEQELLADDLHEMWYLAAVRRARCG